MTDLAAAWDLVHTPPRDAVDVARRSNAARVVAAHGDRLTRMLSVRITECIDLERLRVNVYHRVAPGLLREVRE